jgi:hypothetical protein
LFNHLPGRTFEHHDAHVRPVGIRTLGKLIQTKGNLIKSEVHLHSWMLDKTGMVNTCLLNHRENLQQEQIDIRGESEAEEVLKLHRVLPRCKEDIITWLFYKNVNGLLNRMCSNNKLSKCKDRFDK